MGEPDQDCLSPRDLAATTAVVILLALIWGLAGSGSTRPPPFGAVLGVVFSIALAVALMTLMFYRNRNGMDDSRLPGTEKMAPVNTR